MGNVFADIPPPSYWQDFERITLDMCRVKWRDDYAERNGREGQAQSGVDVYGHDRVTREHVGVQCKKRKTKLNGHRVPSGSLAIKDIDAEIEAAESFVPRLDRFIIATTIPSDNDLQEYVRTLRRPKGSFKVSLWFWDEYTEFLNSNETFMYRYYENVLKYRSRYSNDEHYLRLLALAFDRPAMRTAFHLENRATDFIEAISSLQQLIATGVLKDRTGHLIDEARPPARPSHDLKEVKKLLSHIRDKATDALRTGAIIEHATVIEIRDFALQQELNDLRARVLDHLNHQLTASHIEPIAMRE